MLMLHKILPVLLLPFGFSLLCLLLGLVFHKRLLIWSAVLVLWLFSTPLVGDALMGVVEGGSQRSRAETARKADAIVVLSGMIRQVGGAPLGEWGDAADRFEGGIELFKAGKAPLLVFTGGQVPWEPDSVPEGELLTKRAVLLGIPRRALRVTGKVGNTADEAVAARKLLGADTGAPKRILLVTSAYHMRRAKMLFEKAGFVVEPFRVDNQVSNNNRLTVLNFIPNPGALERSEKALREVIGWLYYLARKNST